jgi:hypothetical protein
MRIHNTGLNAARKDAEKSAAAAQAAQTAQAAVGGALSGAAGTANRKRARSAAMPDMLTKDTVEISDEARQAVAGHASAETAPAKDLLQELAPEQCAEMQTGNSVAQSAEGRKSEDGQLGMEDFQRMLDEMRGRFRELREGLENAQKAGEGMAEAMKEKIRCLQIAMRIMSGDNVPIEDERYLAEKDIKLYNQAKTLRIEKKDPKECDSLLEEEKKADGDGDESAEAQASDGAEATDAEAPSDASSAPPEAATVEPAVVE